MVMLIAGTIMDDAGRGFCLDNLNFIDTYRSFSSSHINLGLEMLVALVLIGIYSQTGQCAWRTWSFWLVGISLLGTPFAFNPFAFEWATVLKNFREWDGWMW